jgi:hypothetical protein
MKVPPTEDTVINSTPEANPDYDRKISDNAKQRVRDVDPNDSRCLVLNSEFGVQFCHCISRKHMKSEDIVCAFP